MLPSEVPSLGGDCVVVIDTFRATTMIATLLDHGASSICAFAEEQAARADATARGAILAGERGGLPPAGFDMGNSPAQVDGRVAGRDVVLFTTNGTRALVGHSVPVFTGAMVNASAAAQLADFYSHIVLVCAGNAGGRRFSMEDFATAGTIAAMMSAHAQLDGGDGLNLARLLLTDDPAIALERAQQILPQTHHADYMRTLDLGDDITFASEPNRFDVLPRVVASGPGWTRLKSA